ncbi:hypothetical protein K3495_g14310 [Podosphaera aphanis]|nr:hypothetical protein K3495_g14310 [Podosphaera aphanis]
MRIIFTSKIIVIFLITIAAAPTPVQRPNVQASHRKQPTHLLSSVKPPKTHPQKLPEENRLLVRVSEGHPALRMSPYAIQQQLNAFLNAKLVREVQMTNTGFAICPVNIEAQEALSVYMGELSGVPRSYASYNDFSMEMTEISATTIAEALTALTNKNWIVLYPKGSTLSKLLPLFGVRVPTKLLPQKFKTPQCVRCFGWDNERSCARIPRCRICGSTQHLEAGHTSCDPSKDHFCPPKCASCHGPLPADSLECLIRPRKDNSLPPKQQIAQIRQAAAAARFRLKAAHCGVMENQTRASAPSNINETPALTKTPPTVGRLFTESPSMTSDRFAPLAEDSLQSSSMETTNDY